MVEGPGDSFRSGTGKVPTPIGTKALSAGRPRCLPRRPQAPLPARGTPCPAQSRLHLSSELRLYTGAGPLQGLGVNTHTSDPVSQALSASPPSPVLQSQHLRWEDEEEDRPPGVEKRGYNNQRAKAPSPAPPQACCRAGGNNSHGGNSLQADRCSELTTCRASRPGVNMCHR